MRMTASYETEENKKETVYLRMVEGVHPAGMSETCESLFETMGYGPLRTFFEAECGDAGGGGGLAVFGHAVFLNAIAYKVAQAAGASEETKRALLDMDLGETQGIHISH